MKQLRYKAFTLLELTIAMLIAAICMGIAYYVLNSFFTLFSNQQKLKNETYGLNRFVNRLKVETLMADQLLLNENKLEISRISYKTEYLFLDNSIIRYQNNMPTDTIFGRSGFIKSVYEENTEGPLLKNLEFAFERNTKSFPIVLEKKYSAEQLMNIQKQD